MQWFPFLIATLSLVVPHVAAQPPTVSRETTYYTQPLDAEGYVDYAAALDRAFGDADTAAEDNAFAGILPHLDTADWFPDFLREHLRLLHEKLGTTPPGPHTPRFVGFPEYAAAHGLDEAAIDVAVEAVWGRPWTTEEFPLAAQWLSDIAPALDAIAAAIDRPNYFAPVIVPPAEPLLLAALVPQLRAHRAIGRSLGSRINLNLATGDLEATVRDILTLERLARLQTREPTLIANLVGISINAISRDAITSLLNHDQLKLHQVLALRDGLTELPPRVPMHRVASMGERANLLDLVQNGHRGRISLLWAAQMLISPDGQADTSAKPQTDPFGALLRDPRFDFDRTLQRINTFWDRFDSPQGDTRFILTHYEQLEQAVDQLRPDEGQLRSFEKLGEVGIPADADASEIADRTADMWLNYFALRVAGAISAENQSAAYDLIQDVGIALAIYRFDVGGYPKTLDELVPDYLGELPTDPFNPGQPLTYRPQDTGYLLYSWNDDFEDDQGLDDIAEGDLVLRVGPPVNP